MSLGGWNDKLKLGWLKTLLAVIVVFLLGFGVWRQLKARKPVLYREFALDTIVEIQLWDGDERAARRALEEMRRVEGLLSRFQKESDLSRLQSKGKVEVSPETYDVLGQALKLARASNGSYDPTIGPLSDLWAQAQTAGRPPEKAEVIRASALVDYRRVKLQRGHVVEVPSGTVLDLGGIAKGYAVDRALAVLKEAGVDRALINAGGQIGLLGSAPRGKWQIGVQAPRAEGVVAVLELTGGAVSTSGDYQRFFRYRGRRYHHLLDSTTGYPASLCQSATVVAESGLLADVLSTACFLLGPERGLALVREFGAEALVVDEKGQLKTTAGLNYRKKGRE